MVEPQEYAGAETKVRHRPPSGHFRTQQAAEVEAPSYLTNRERGQWKPPRHERRRSSATFVGPGKGSDRRSSSLQAVARHSLNASNVYITNAQSGRSGDIGRRSSIPYYGGVVGRARMSSVMVTPDDELEINQNSNSILREEVLAKVPSVQVRPPLLRPHDEPVRFHFTLADEGSIESEPETNADVLYTDYVKVHGSHRAALQQKFRDEEAEVDHQAWLVRKEEFEIYTKKEAEREKERRWTRGLPRQARNVKEAIHLERFRKLERLELHMSERDDVDQLVHQAPYTNRLDLQGKLKDNNIELFEALMQDERTLRVIEARLARNCLREVPEKLHIHLPLLQVLDLSQNLLENLPADLEKLTNLQELNIQYNKFEEVPQCVYSLPKLSIFIAGGNTFLDLHYRIARAKTLKRLSLDNNKIVTLPLALSELTHCEYLNLNHNNLETLALFPPPAYTSMTVEELRDDLKNWKPIVDPRTGEKGFIHQHTRKGRRSLTALYDEAMLDQDPELEGFDVNGEDAMARFISGNSEPSKNSSSNTVNQKTSPPDPSILTKLDLSKIVDKTRINKRRLKQRQALAQAKKPEWKYWINDENGSTEYGNLVTNEVIRQGIPRVLDRWNTLEHLRELFLNCNQLTDLPASLGKLPRLERLEASQNRLVFIPEEVTLLPQLRFLVLRENRLEVLPTTIGRLSQLEQLELSGNCIRDIPSSMRQCINLRILNLTTNNIEELNSGIGDLPNLTDLSLIDNPHLRHPSPDVARQGAAAILWDCRNREKLRLIGPPPPAVLRENVGVSGEHHVVEGLYHKKLSVIFERARVTGILKLHFFGLRALPDQTFSLTRLRELRISGHATIRAIPKHVSRLHSLQVLSFPANALESLPETLAFWKPLQELTELDFSDNRIVKLPAAIHVLSKLKVINVNGNLIEEIDGKVFSGGLAKSLQRILLNSNRIRELPSEISELSELQDLQLTYNCLSALPKEIGSLEKLERLYLSRNQIQKLPSSLGDLPYLRSLQVASNKLTRLQPRLWRGKLRFSLEILHIQINEICELPSEMHELQALKQIIFDGNPIISPPLSLNGRTWAATEVVEYCAERHRRRKMIVALLREAAERDNHFDVDPLKLTPVCNGAVIDKHQYLGPEEKKEVDLLLDHFLNGRYYQNSKSGFDVTKRVCDIFDACRNAKLRIVLDDFVRLIEVLHQNGLLLKEDFYAKSRVSFGRNHDPVNCYALRLSAFYRESREESASDIDNDEDDISDLSSLSESSLGFGDGADAGDESDDDDIDAAFEAPNLVQAAAALPRQVRFVFEHDQTLLELALQTYRGPYGQVAWLKAPYNFETNKLEYREYIEVLEEVIPKEHHQEHGLIDSDVESDASSIGSNAANFAHGELESKSGGPETAVARSLGFESLEHRGSTLLKSVKVQERFSSLRKSISANVNLASAQQNLVLAQQNFQTAKESVRVALDEQHRSLSLLPPRAMFEAARKKLAVFLKFRPRSPFAPPLPIKVYNFQPSSKEEHEDILLLAQFLYTIAESKRREAEEILIAFAKRRAQKTFLEWCGRNDGKKRLNAVAVDRIGRASEVYSFTKASLHDARDNLSVAEGSLQEAQDRVKAFESGAPVHMHRIKNQKKALKLIADSEGELEMMTKRVATLEKKLQAAQARKRLKLKQMVNTTREEVLEIVLQRATVLCVHERRIQALQQRWRRPWDGENGSDFEVWKLTRKRAMVDQGIEDPTAMITDEDMEDPPPDDIIHVMFDPYAYDSFFEMLDQEGSSNEEADENEEVGQEDIEDIADDP